MKMVQQLKVGQNTQHMWLWSIIRSSSNWRSKPGACSFEQVPGGDACKFIWTKVKAANKNQVTFLQLFEAASTNFLLNPIIDVPMPLVWKLLLCVVPHTPFALSSSSYQFPMDSVTNTSLSQAVELNKLAPTQLTYCLSSSTYHCMDYSSFVS